MDAVGRVRHAPRGELGTARKRRVDSSTAAAPFVTREKPSLGVAYHVEGVVYGVPIPNSPRLAPSVGPRQAVPDGIGPRSSAVDGR